MTESALGWALLSREALRRAEEHLREDEQGVLDEIGFLALHKAYADRFFPGTSVLQTRMKYVLFVPWIYERVARTCNERQARALIQQEELALAGRLKATYGASEGVIGGRSYPRPTSQPPSFVYWTALTTWGIVRPLADGSFPSGAMVLRWLSRSRPVSRLQDDDGQPLEEERSLFVALPRPPVHWNNTAVPMTFDLDATEARFIRQQLIGVNRPGQLSGLCLLARMAERKVSVKDVEHPWLRDMLAIAEEDDAEALLRAQQAAALAAIGRAVYAALVEHICEVDDARPMSRRHQSHLERMVQEHGREALKLDIAALQQDAPNRLSPHLLDVLRETQTWLRHHGHFLDLRLLYEEAEIARKGRRACLAGTLAARERRAGWDTEAAPHPLAEPLHYRWRNVQRLLGDL